MNRFLSFLLSWIVFPESASQHIAKLFSLQQYEPYPYRFRGYNPKQAEMDS